MESDIHLYIVLVPKKSSVFIYGRMNIQAKFMSLSGSQVER